MIEALVMVLTALSFGVGVTLTLLGFILFYQVFFSDTRFNSWTVVTQIAFLLSTIGLTLLWLVAVRVSLLV